MNNRHQKIISPFAPCHIESTPSSLDECQRRTKEHENRLSCAVQKDKLPSCVMQKYNNTI